MSGVLFLLQRMMLCEYYYIFLAVKMNGLVCGNCNDVKMELA